MLESAAALTKACQQRVQLDMHPQQLVGRGQGNLGGQSGFFPGWLLSLKVFFQIKHSCCCCCYRYSIILFKFNAKWCGWLVRCNSCIFKLFLIRQSKRNFQKWNNVQTRAWMCTEHHINHSSHTSGLSLISCSVNRILLLSHEDRN